MTENRGNAARARSWRMKWYMTKCNDEYAGTLLYVAEQYPYTYARTVTFLDQLQSSGPEETREGHSRPPAGGEKVVNARRGNHRRTGAVL